MTLPLWAPFFGLAVACSIWPRPRWTRRIDWLCVYVWTLALGCCAVFWLGVACLVEWAIS